MKKIFSLFILTSLAIGLTSCGEEKNVSNSELQKITQSPCLSETGSSPTGDNVFGNLIQQAIERSTQSGQTQEQEVSESGRIQENTIDLESGIPKYQKLQVKFNDLYVGKEIWSPEIQKIEKEYQMAMKNAVNGGASNPSDIIIKRNILLNGFYTSNEYLEYLKGKKEVLNAINEEIKTELNTEKVK